MSEYADLSDHDSLCYWLEHGTKQLGAIGNVPNNKFELWKPNRKEKVFKGVQFRLESGYAYNSSKGNNLESAFRNIRELVLDIVSCSQDGNFNAVDDIPFHSISKWKLAFLFSGKRLLPVYSRRALFAISTGLGHSFSEASRISEIQAAILNHKPAGEDVIDFSHRIYKQFADKPKTANFYIVGSRYDEPVISDFLALECVAIGQLKEMDFSAAMGADRATVDRLVEGNYTAQAKLSGKTKSYFRLLSQISEGDIIAVKSKGAYNNLEIIAYAQVVKKEGAVYYHDQDKLGHHIHVTFLDAGFVKRIDANYAGTIHRLTPNKDGATFYDIFGWYGKNDTTTSDGQPEGSDTIIKAGYNEKSEDSFERSPAAKVVVQRIHNRIQNRFIQYLSITFPGKKCSGEKMRMDALMESENDLTIYEIKPNPSVYMCIREGIGQLLDYHHQLKTVKKKKLVIVGPTAPDKEDLQFLKEVRLNLNVAFSYMAFDDHKLTATEF